MFRALASSDFPPFGSIRMDFPEVENKPEGLAEVHLLTGINGTGKTRILAVLAAALGQPESIQKRFKGAREALIVTLGNVVHSIEGLPANTTAKYQVSGNSISHQSAGHFVQWAQKVPAFAYSGSAFVADSEIGLMTDVPKPDRKACLAFNRYEGQSGPLLQAVANLKLQSAMEHLDPESDQANRGRATSIISELERVISQITGRAFSFSMSGYPKPVLAVTWGHARIPFDGLPEGLRSIVGWLAHAVVMMDALLQGQTNPFQTPAIFLLDEIEGFLHPAWQRKVLPAFQHLFPRAQMFVATHSPFLIASLNHGWIHQLVMDSNGRVEAKKPTPASEGDSYITVVEDIMGVREWFDPESEALLEKFRSKRDAAYAGDGHALESARLLAVQIGQRSMELGYMMGRELHQMDRQLAKVSKPQ